MNNDIGRFGILTCKLIDPFHLIIDKISSDDEYNSIGVYYINNESNYVILLFNIYNGNPVRWISPSYIMSCFLSSNYVTKIKFYSLEEKCLGNNFKNIYSIHGRFNMLCDDSRNYINKLEEKFINIISGISIFFDYNYLNYDDLLINIINQKKLGYEIITKIFNLLDNNNLKDFSESLLIKNISYLEIKKKCNYINIIDNEFDEIIATDIKKLRESFIKIYNDNPSLLNIDHSIFNNDIDKLIIKDEVIIKTSELINFGYNLEKLINSDEKIEQCSILKNIIIIYNNLIMYFNIKKIEITEEINLKLNPNLILSATNMIEIISIIQSNINDKNKTCLEVLSEIQLFDVLIYIDSLRDLSGSFDNKFTGIQNLITQEVIFRKNNKI